MTLRSKTLFGLILLAVCISTQASATCCSNEVLEEEIAWEHMDEVEREGECQCEYGEFVRTGTLVTVWEPVRIIETVKDPYCMVSAGEDSYDDGTEVPGEGDNSGGGGETESDPWINAGTHSDTGAQEDHSVFQNVHIILPDYIHQSIQQVDNRCWHSSVGNPMDYISEDDAAWSDDTIAAATYPLTSMAADYDMIMECERDAYSSQLGLPNSILFWCMGAWGSTYPMSGHYNNDEYVTGNIALAARAIYIGGRTGRIHDAASYYCYAGPMPLWIALAARAMLPVTYSSLL